MTNITYIMTYIKNPSWKLQFAYLVIQVIVPCLIIVPGFVWYTAVINSRGSPPAYMVGYNNEISFLISFLKNAS